MRNLSYLSATLMLAVLMAVALVQRSAIHAETPEVLAGENTSVDISDPVTFAVDFSAVVTAPYHTEVLRVWMPIPPSDDVQQISERQLSTFPMNVEPEIDEESVFGNRFAYFEFHNPHGAQIIRHRFNATVSNVHWNLEPQRVTLPQTMDGELAASLKPQEVATTEKFKNIFRTIKPNATEGSSAKNLFQAMAWIEENLTYDHVHASLQADANHALMQQRGHCSDYHGLCSTFGRTLGFPSRVTYGLALFPKNSPSHCKMEALLPPYGWVSFDLSETQKMIRKIAADESLDQQTKDRLTTAARQRLVGGFRENSWLMMTRGENYELVPRASRPVAVVRTIYAEADGVPLPEPDPANIDKREFGWMTVHQYTADKPVIKPFKDLSTLEP